MTTSRKLNKSLDPMEQNYKNVDPNVINSCHPFQMFTFFKLIYVVPIRIYLQFVLCTHEIIHMV